jgi:ABC-2 type transport system permease protein
MMRQLRAVLRVTVNSTFGLSAFRWRYLVKRERSWEAILMAVSIASGVGFLSYTVYRLALAVAAAGLMLGQPELALGLAALISQVLVLVMGFFLVVSAFYFARDLTTLVPLPVAPGTIITAKFLTVLISEYLTISLIFIPALIAYWQVVPAHPAQALAAALVFLALPVIPLAIGASIPLVMFRGISRRQRDVMFYAASLLFLGLVVLWQAAVGRISAGANMQEYLEQLVTGQLGLVRALTGRFLPALWATIAVHGSPGPEGLRYLAYTLGSAGLAIAGLGALGNRLFYRGLIGGDEAASKRRPSPSGQRGARSGTAASAMAGLGTAPLLPLRRTPLRALIAREWLGLARTPIWMFNNVLPGLLMPAFALLPILTGGGMRQLLAALADNPANFAVAGLSLAGFLVFIGGVNGLAATAISREGGRFWQLRVQPQPAMVQLQAKLLLSWLVFAATSLPTVVAFGVLLRPPALHVVAPTVVGLVAGLGIMALGLRIDARRPMLRWHDPQEPVKRNLNAMVPVGLALAAVAGGGALAASLVRGGAAPGVTYLVLALAAGAMTSAAYGALRAASRTIFDHLEA